LTELNPQASLIPPAADIARRGPDGAPAYDEPLYLGLTMDAWVKVAILAPLFIAVYWLVLRWLWDKTNPINGEANWGHAICIPAVGLYYLFINRDELLRQPIEPLLLGKLMNPWRLYPALAMIVIGAATWLLGPAASPLVGESGLLVATFGILVLLFDWGLGSLLFGLRLFAYGIWPGQNQFVQGCAMIVTLFGMVLMLTGWRVMQYAYFPIFYLICGIPWPALVYSYIAAPLQTLAARAAVVTLRFTGVNAYRTGTKINMGGITEPLRTLNVAEACAGLRSLMTFITVGVAVAFLSARPFWQKIIISLSAIPIAIGCNVMRVAGQGLLDHYVSRQLSESFAHQFVGLVMLVPAFFMILLVGWILDHLFVEEAELRQAEAERRASVMGAARTAGGLVVDIPRRTVIPPAPPQQHMAPRAAKAPVQAPVGPGQRPGAASPKVTPPAAPTAAPKPAAPVTPPPRPGIVPPRPGIVPPRPTGGPGAVPKPAPRPGVPPAQRPGIPPAPRPPQPPLEGQ
jgi:exosortase